MFEAMDVEQIQPNVVVYNRLIGACKAASQWDLALSLWQQMPSRQVEPDTVTFSAVIAGTMRGDDG